MPEKVKTSKRQEMDVEEKGNGRYPYYVFLIIMNEFCERFSFYGLKTVLYLYLTEFIMLEKNTATSIYHGYTMLCYFTPLMGAIISDGFFGLYKTIIGLSIVYLIGEIIVTLTAIGPLGAPNLAGPVIGLIIIAIGTGGIKPCVGAFGGNQFKPHQKKYIETFFSIFYMSINIGSLISTFLTPILRSDVKCFGNDCYPLAFGVPAIVMLISIILFIAGTPYYTRDDKKKGSSNVITDTAGCIARAVSKKIANKGEKREHWLDYADDKYSDEILKGVKAFCKVFFVFIPLPIFWALYDQQGSRWTDQAQQLDGRIGSINIKPDQFQIVNPLLIIILVPVFDYAIYPLCARINFLKSLLQRMAVGLLLAVAAFLIAALLEYNMQQSSAALNLPNQLRVINLEPCDVHFTNLENNQLVLSVGQVNKRFENRAVNFDKQVLDSIFKNNQNATLVYNRVCSTGKNVTREVFIEAIDLPKTMILHSDDVIFVPYSAKEQKIGASELKFLSLDLDDIPLTPILEGRDYTFTEVYDVRNSSSIANIYGLKVDFGDYKVDVTANGTDFKLNHDIILEISGRYSILLFTRDDNALDYVLMTDLYPNGLHLGWQVVQTFVMTLGEIMFSISGVTFAYSQAPASMKSVLQATWFLTVAFGNLIVMIVALVKIENQVYEYIGYGALLTVATIIFAIMSYFYKPIESEPQKASDDEQLYEDNNRKKDRLNNQEYDNQSVMKF